MPIINSILDTDLYKLTMNWAVLTKYPNAYAQYAFINRRLEGAFNDRFLNAFNDELEQMPNLKLRNNEVGYLMEATPFLPSPYLRWLADYRFNPNEISAKVVNGELELKIMGNWARTILWEVPLMAIISELHFIHCDTDWDDSQAKQLQKLEAKANLMRGISLTDFGTRRRRNYGTQDMVVKYLKNNFATFRGTSNVHLAHKHETKPMGTMAHEWIMGVSALESLRHANRYALHAWAEVYKGNLGIALTDTFGTKAFWPDFDGVLARLFDGIRHDSACPYKFTDEAIVGYNKLHIRPSSRTIVFSDGLTPIDAVNINRYCSERDVRSSFGIGTNLTNDYEKKSIPTEVSKPLNMVIKMTHCDRIPVVKLSDTPSKAIGDRDALRVAKWVFDQTPLDA